MVLRHNDPTLRFGLIMSPPAEYTAIRARPASVRKKTSVFSRPLLAVPEIPSEFLTQGIIKRLLEVEAPPKALRVLISSYPGRKAMEALSRRETPDERKPPAEL